MPARCCRRSSASRSTTGWCRLAWGSRPVCLRRLECKNAAVAGHALRVALACSAWAVQMGLPDDERDDIEIAALLHDVGMIGAPDDILLKPGTLNDNEAAIWPVPQNEPEHSPPQLRVAAGSGDRGEHSGLVRRQPRGFAASGPQLPLGAG